MAKTSTSKKPKKDLKPRPLYDERGRRVGTYFEVRMKPKKGRA